MTARGRSGFSLLEVLLATSILLGSAVVLGQLATIGRMHATAAHELVTAQLLCETRLNQLMLGALPLEEIEEEPVAEAPGWLYTVEILPTDEPELSSLRVTVAEEERGARKPYRYSLTRWIRDPNAGATANRGGRTPRAMSTPRRGGGAR
jgi:type II secretion system protein I